MKLGKKEISKVMGTSKAQSIVSSRNQSKLTSRKGSMDGVEESMKIESDRISARTEGGKIINRLESGE